MRAMRATALTAALMVGLMSASATGASAAGDKVKGYITTNQGTLSFHASSLGKGGFEWILSDRTIIVGKVTCYQQHLGADGSTTGTLGGTITKSGSGPIRFYLEDGAGSTDSLDAYLYGGASNTCDLGGNLPANRISGYIDMR